MTTLELFCKTFGWQGGTIHQAKQRFAIASKDEMNRFCSQVTSHLRELTDPETALWFVTHRREAVKLHIRAIRSGH